MENLYSFDSTAGFSQPPEMVATAGGMVSPADYVTFGGFDDRFLAFGSDPLFPGSSPVVSDEASTVAETRKGGTGDDVSGGIRAKIASHPLFPKLLEAYIDCRKVGVPPEIASVLEEIRRESEVCGRTAVSTFVGVDPELDDFMESYCDVLVKCKSDLSKPFDEATMFLNEMQMELNSLCNNGGTSSTSYFSDEGGGSSEEELSGGEMEGLDFPRLAGEDRELKDKLLRKYSGYISNLKHQFSKKKKKGRLPKEATQILLDWWTLHYIWPYPTEGDKVALAEVTGLDQKQINNWFINQRKRHWKPPENMQVALMDPLYGPFSSPDE
ncbi:hypothetical protein UlMin_007956 [Ulmus minor]